MTIELFVLLTVMCPRGQILGLEAPQGHNLLALALVLVLKDSHWSWPWTNVVGLGQV